MVVNASTERSDSALVFYELTRIIPWNRWKVMKEEVYFPASVRLCFQGLQLLNYSWLSDYALLEADLSFVTYNKHLFLKLIFSVRNFYY